MELFWIFNKKKYMKMPTTVIGTKQAFVNICWILVLLGVRRKKD